MQKLMPNYLAWTMADGHTMAGEIIKPEFFGATDSRVAVRRVDGSRVELLKTATRPATIGDVETAIAFYSTPGPLYLPLADRLAAAGR